MERALMAVVIGHVHRHLALLDKRRLNRVEWTLVRCAGCAQHDREARCLLFLRR
jgi:hypothetical protein